MARYLLTAVINVEADDPQEAERNARELTRAAESLGMGWVSLTNGNGAPIPATGPEPVE